MKNSKRDIYSSDDRMNDVLDKISRYGIEALSKTDREFLDSYSNGTQEETHKAILSKETELVFDDDFGFFKFEYQETIHLKDQIHYIGTLYVPDLIDSGKRISGILRGRIVLTCDFQVIPEFDNGSFDTFDFCSGLEYELDVFLDYVVQKINEKNRN